MNNIISFAVWIPLLLIAAALMLNINNHRKLTIDAVMMILSMLIIGIANFAFNQYPFILRFAAAALCLLAVIEIHSYVSKHQTVISKK
ncbi:MAG TPA: hypothetical protein VN426_12225 [Syntrophomonadaceae bacterium]|nr:hypothetical protein [Syntrophomonadaceae bacterium]